MQTPIQMPIQVVDNAFDLSDSLTAIIPQARLEIFSLDTKPKIELSLISANYPKGRLPDEIALKLMENPLYWAFCWASGAVLAQYILKNKNKFSGRRVIDFGSGSGVVAIAAALAGAREVIACDIDPLALDAAKHNAEINGVSLTYRRDFDVIDGPVDFIIAADVLYDRDNYPWLEKFSRRTQNVLIADSRVKNFNFSGYRLIEKQDACTLPDLDESKEFRVVSIYQHNSPV